MQDVNGKRDIEAVCDSWEDGLIGYLVWKMKQFFERFEKEGLNGINLDELHEEELFDINGGKEIDFDDVENNGLEITDDKGLFDEMI